SRCAGKRSRETPRLRSQYSAGVPKHRPVYFHTWLEANPLGHIELPHSTRTLYLLSCVAVRNDADCFGRARHRLRSPDLVDNAPGHEDVLPGIFRHGRGDVGVAAYRRTDRRCVSALRSPLSVAALKKMG